MNNLPDTLEGLIKLLQEFRDTECTDPDFKTFNPELLGEKVDALLDKYEALGER